MSSSSESSQLPDYLDRRGWVVPPNLEMANQERQRLTRTLLGVFVDVEFFTSNRVQEYDNTHWFLRVEYFQLEIIAADWHADETRALQFARIKSTQRALNNYLDQLAMNTLGQNLPFLVDYDAYLFNHMIRAFPNTQEYMNTTIYLQPSPEREPSPDARDDRKRDYTNTSEDDNDDDRFDEGRGVIQNMENQPPVRDTNENILRYILRGDPYMQAVIHNEEANRRNIEHMQEGIVE
ncbi:hypothetical protein LIER_33400 [Lithospermum erythrorhizon]|uniref:Uncharacterized protein n=1 Tax=Lithospermum erythrorhizon TaxID=34254 RepID=A0AAV3RY01_LITER